MLLKDIRIWGLLTAKKAIFLVKPYFIRLKQIPKEKALGLGEDLYIP